jgi:hypothetical protein
MGHCGYQLFNYSSKNFKSKLTPLFVLSSPYRFSGEVGLKILIFKRRAFVKKKMSRKIDLTHSNENQSFYSKVQ